MNILMVEGEMINRNMVQKERKKILQTINTPMPDSIRKVIKNLPDL